MREQGVESTGPLAQVELRKEWLVHRFQGCQDVAHFSAGVTCNAAERFEFVKAAAELEPGGIRQIERLLQGNRGATSSRNQTQPKPTWSVTSLMNIRCSSERS